MNGLMMSFGFFVAGIGLGWLIGALGSGSERRR